MSDRTIGNLSRIEQGQGYWASQPNELQGSSPQRRLTSGFDLEKPGGSVRSIFSFQVQAQLRTG